jgi:hypothetical protein
MYLWWEGAELDLGQAADRERCPVDIGELGSDPDIEKKQ